MNDWNDFNKDIDAIRAIGKKQSPTTQRKRAKGRKTQKRGADGEKIARAALENYGVCMLRKVGKDVSIIPVDTRQALYRVHFIGKLEADYRGLLNNGRSVLVEVKTISGDRLTYSEVKKHQHAALLEHDRLGGLSLLVWVHNGEARIYEYPIDGYEPRKSLCWEIA